MEKTFNSVKIERNSELFNYINNRSYVDNPYIKLEDLRYITLLYNDFNGEKKIGHLIVNKEISDDTLYIFEELYKNGYQLNSVELIEKYWTKDNSITDQVSMSNNNSSSFNYRIIHGRDYLSYHALGLAIDINPVNNPYIINENGKLNYDDLSEEELFYAKNRNSDVEHVITHDDLAYKLFTSRGFEWGGDWDCSIYSLDYQHFEKPVINNKILVK